MIEYKPTEHIVDFGDCRSSQFVRLNMALIEQNGAKLHEKIVRCRDCKHWREIAMADGTKGHRCSGAMAFVECSPDGFCAWGERENHEQD